MRAPPKVSVIVPVYNTGKYLRQCLDSIVAQTLRDLEIIVVNDGSTDDSPAIIREYAARDDRIVVINKPNGGLGAAYNRGIDAATAPYIGFVESDDWIEPDMFHALYDEADGADIVKGRHISFDDRTGKNLRRSVLPAECGRDHSPADAPQIFYDGPSIWTAIYRADFLKDNDIRFLESPGASYQDAGFNFKAWAAAARIRFLDRVVLHYRTGHAGQSVRSRDKAFCISDEFAEVDRWLARRPDAADLIRAKNRAKYFSYDWNLKRLDGENRAAFFERMRDEFAPVLLADEIDLGGMPAKARWQMRARFAPSLWARAMYAMSAALRPFIRTRRRGGRMIWYALSFIPLWSGVIKTKAFAIVPAARRKIA